MFIRILKLLTLLTFMLCSSVCSKAQSSETDFFEKYPVIKTINPFDFVSYKNVIFGDLFVTTDKRFLLVTISPLKGVGLQKQQILIFDYKSFDFISITPPLADVIYECFSLGGNGLCKSRY